MAAWKKIADAVHAKGGRIFMQFMHVGRIGHSANRYTSEPLVAPSVVRAAGQMWTDAHGLQDIDTPRALETSEIPGVIDDYAQATRNALAAGFDGVELHSASGYLPMQFLSTGTNKRTDGYGGSVQNRIRFVVEALRGDDRRPPATRRRSASRSARRCRSTTSRTTTRSRPTRRS